MSLVPQNATVHPRGTIFKGVHLGTEEPRPWMDGLPVCPALAQHQIIHCGLATAPPGYRIARQRQTTAYFLAPLSGQGRVWVNDRWRTCQRGQASLLPAGIAECFETTGRAPWKFVWVCYQQLSHQEPIAALIAPLIIPYIVEPLEMAALGLHAECAGGASPALTHFWVELVHRYVTQVVLPLPEDDAFARAWQQVGAKLAHNWTVESLAKEAGCNREKLRTLCASNFGRPPMHQLAYMRMRRAAQLLVTKGEKLESIALSVGYSNPFVFSNAVLKWTGFRPSEFREREKRG